MTIGRLQGDVKKKNLFSFGDVDCGVDDVLQHTGITQLFQERSPQGVSSRVRKGLSVRLLGDALRGDVGSVRPICQDTENALLTDLHDQPLGYNDGQASQDKISVSIEFDENRSESDKPSSGALGPVCFQWPGKRDL